MKGPLRGPEVVAPVAMGTCNKWATLLVPLPLHSYHGAAAELGDDVELRAGLLGTFAHGPQAQMGGVEV